MALVVDTGFYTSVKGLALSKKYGAVTFAVHALISAHLYQSETGYITLEQAEEIFIVSNLESEQAQACLDELCSKNVFIKTNEGFTSQAILDDKARLEEKRTKWRENGNRGGRPKTKEEPNQEDANQDLPQDNQTITEQEPNNNPIERFGYFTKPNTNPTEYEYEYKNNELILKNNNINNKYKITPEVINQIQFPEKLDDDEFKEAFKRWIEYKQLNKKRMYSTIAAIKSQLTNLAKSNPTPSLAIYAIDEAIKNEWKGIELYPNVVKGWEGTQGQQPTKQVLYDTPEDLIPDFAKGGF